MGKTPVRMKAVIYALSPFQQKVMSGLWKDIPHKIEKKVAENWISATLLLSPLVGTYTSFTISNDKDLKRMVDINRDNSSPEIYVLAKGSGPLVPVNETKNIPSRYVQYYKEKEKLEHRY